jgi:hypothetical protein
MIDFTTARRATQLAAIAGVRLACVLAPLVLLALPVAASAQQVVRIPGTTISLTAPPGFKVARNFSGLENEATGSQIMLVETPVSARAELLAAFSSPKTLSSKYASQGIRITRIEQIALDGGQAPLAIGGKAQNGREVVTYLSTFGGNPELNTMAVLATVTVSPGDTLTRTDVEALLRSVKLARVPTNDEKLARLTFSFKVVPPFQVANVEAANVLLTSTVKAQTVSSTPAIVINRALTQSAPGDVAKVSEALLRGTAGFRDAQIKEQAAAEFAGGPGYRITADAGALSIIQYVRVMPGGRFIRFAARGGIEALPATSDAVTEIASSVELKE